MRMHTRGWPKQPDDWENPTKPRKRRGPRCASLLVMPSPTTSWAISTAPNGVTGEE